MALDLRDAGLINFRYHLVSLTAIFLALGLGIAMGAAVVDRALVDALEDQLNRVGRRADAVAQTNDRLGEELGEWATFTEQAGDQLFAGRLAEVPVAIVTFAGVDRDALGQLEASVRAAGASIPARIALTTRFELGDAEATAELARLVDAGSVDPTAVREEAARRLAEAWAGRARPELIADLVATDFLEVAVEPASAAVANLAELAPRFLVVSSAEADVDNQTLAVPLVTAMSELSLPVVAADTTVAAESAPPDEQAPFVAPLREADQVRGRISTVDNAATFRGRVAAILSLAILGQDRVGQFGTGPGAERLLPN